MGRGLGSSGYSTALVSAQADLVAPAVVDVCGRGRVWLSLREGLPFAARYVDPCTSVYVAKEIFAHPL
jgi:hypothetical protein